MIRFFGRFAPSDAVLNAVKERQHKYITFIYDDKLTRRQINNKDNFKNLIDKNV